MIINNQQKYLIIGDVHGCIDELKSLLLKNGFLIDSNGKIYGNEDTSIILLGDFVDKASHKKLEETIAFIYKNITRLYLIRGNHEWMVYRYITDDPALEIDEKKDKYYNTASLLEQDKKLKEKFLYLYSNTHVWLKYEFSKDFSIVLTHAPCKKKFLQKTDKYSINKMVKSKSRSENRSISLDELISYIHLEAEDNEHYHIFGHLSQPDIRRYKNKICIDTSCIYGNCLSSVFVDGDKMTFDGVDFMHLQKPSTQKYDILFDLSR